MLMGLPLQGEGTTKGSSKKTQDVRWAACREKSREGGEGSVEVVWSRGERGWKERSCVVPAQDSKVRSILPDL